MAALHYAAKFVEGLGRNGQKEELSGPPRLSCTKMFMSPPMLPFLRRYKTGYIIYGRKFILERCPLAMAGRSSFLKTHLIFL